MLGHLIFTKVFISFFTLDFIIRVINPNYAPSLLVGRFFVRNQTPEYVGASQKRFAWGLGLALALPMFDMIVVDFVPNPIKIVICIICLFLLISESAFSICFGCKIYNFFNKEKATNCPGGVCEIKVKDDIVKFNIMQIIIVLLVVVFTFSSLYLFVTRVESKTFIANRISKMMMTQEEIEALEEAEFQRDAQDFDFDD